jgi:hypothetical protein
MQPMMKRFTYLTVLLLCFSVLLLADDKPKPIVYSATVIPAGAGVRPVSIKLYVSGETTDAEVQQLAMALKSGGMDALEKAMDKMENGRVTPVKTTGTSVAVVRTKKTDKGQRITMVTNRPITFPELWNSTRSADYPFGIVQLDLDDQGKGEGSIIVAAKIEFTADNQITVESYGIGPSKLMAVSRLN